MRTLIEVLQILEENPNRVFSVQKTPNIKVYMGKDGTIRFEDFSNAREPVALLNMKWNFIEYYTGDFTFQEMLEEIEVNPDVYVRPLELPSSSVERKLSEFERLEDVLSILAKSLYTKDLVDFLIESRWSIIEEFN